MNGIKNFIFDLDGTLLNTSAGIKEAVSYTINELGLEMLPDSILNSFIGPPIQTSFKSYFELDNAVAQNAANIFRDYYKNYSLYNAVPYDGIYETLEEIKKKEKTISVATFKREDYAIKILHKFRFDYYCKSIHGGDNYNQKTKSDIIELCMDEIKASSMDTIYIGDTNGDLKASKEIGIKMVAVAYGFGFKHGDNLNSDDVIAVIDTPSQLLNIIGTNNSCPLERINHP